MTADVIVIHRPKWLRELTESIDLHMEYIAPIVDDVDRVKFIESMITTQLTTPGAYFGNFEYIYTTSAFYTKSSYNHFELFDDMVSDLSLSEEVGCFTEPLIPLVRDKHFSLRVDLYMGVVTLWIDR